MNLADLETLKRSREIDREAAQLIRDGMSPWEARTEAARIVDGRRQEKARMRRHV